MSEFGPDAATGHGPAESRSPADAGTSWRFVSTQAGAHADRATSGSGWRSFGAAGYTSSYFCQRFKMTIFKIYRRQKL